MRYDQGIQRGDATGGGEDNLRGLDFVLLDLLVLVERCIGDLNELVLLREGLSDGGIVLDKGILNGDFLLRGHAAGDGLLRGLR